MARALVRTRSTRGKSVKCGACGEEVKPGEKYYKWSFRYGGTYHRCAKHPPKPSDLTQSKMSTVYAAQEAAAADLAAANTLSDVRAAVAVVAEAAREVADEYHQAAENFGQSGENQERGDELESYADELEAWEPGTEVSEEEALNEDDLDAVCQEAEEAINECPL